MKKIILILGFLFSFGLFAQEPVWDQGIPICPDNEYISKLTDKINLSEVRDGKELSDETRSICRDIGLAFYDLEYKEEADWYLSKSKDFHFKGKMTTINNEKSEEPKITEDEIKSIENDVNFLNNIPKSFDNVSRNDMKNLAKQIEEQIQKLSREKDSLLKTINPNKKIIESKENIIGTLKKDKEIIGLTIQTQDLKSETKTLKIKSIGLEIEKGELKIYLWVLGAVLLILTLVILVLSQRKTIKVQDVEIEHQLKDISVKNTYIEHAARIIRHDMHSGINTYIPRGINSLEKRLTDEESKKLKIDSSIKMIKEGLKHTQKVYKSVYEFTNLVKKNSILETKKCDLREILNNHLLNTSYTSQVEIKELINCEVNEILFCNAIDNLIKNGLKYNDNSDKKVKIYIEDNYLIIEDNGLGLTEKKLEKILISNPKDNKENGLGLKISAAILNEHGFELSCEKQDVGTKMKIKLNKEKTKV